MIKKTCEPYLLFALLLFCCTLIACQPLNSEQITSVALEEKNDLVVDKPDSASSRVIPDLDEKSEVMCSIGFNSMQGKILDVSKQPVKDALIKVEVQTPLTEIDELNCQSILQGQTTSSEQGEYRLAKIADQVLVKITASKLGYKTKTRMEILTSRSLESGANSYDFVLEKDEDEGTAKVDQ